MLHEQRKNQDLICCDITDLGLCLHRARKFPSAANLSVHSTHSAQHTQLKCSSSLPVGLRWHLWGAISISVAPPGDPPKVHHRCSEVYAASSTYRHMAPWQATDSGWNTASNSSLLALQLFQQYNYLPNTKAALIHTAN